MSRVPASHLGALREGAALFLRHPALAFGLAGLAMVLTQVGPALELAAGVSSFLAQPLFAFAGLLPLEMYFIPRLQARLDAELRSAPENALSDWPATFDRRWAKAFLLRLGLSLLIALGLLLFVIPGIVVLALFGWAPLRLLVRGDAPLAALRWSQGAMARHWPRVVQAVLAMALVAMLYQVAAGWSLTRLVPAVAAESSVDALLRLKHPAFWAFGLLGGVVNVWLSCALLALYHRLEAAVADAGAGQPSSPK